MTADDSYTPQKLSFRAGTHHSDLSEIQHVELVSPTGWQHFVLARDPKMARVGEQERYGVCFAGGWRPGLTPSLLCSEPVRAHLLQIAILTNHLNGKDTHIRGVRVFAPRQ